MIQQAPEKGHHEGHGNGHVDEGDDHESEDKGGHVEDAELGELVPNLHKDEHVDAGAEEEEGSSEEGGESKVDDSGDTQANDGSDGQQKETPVTSDDEESQGAAHVTDSGENVEGVQFKGATSGGTRDGEQGDTRKHIPDAKGGNKKRIESDYGKRQGVAGEDHEVTDQPHDDVRAPPTFIC